MSAWRSQLLQSQRFWCGLVLLPLLAIAGEGAAATQAYSFDARKVGMGGVVDNSNIAALMVESEAPYAVIPIPIGLIQIFQSRNQFDPTSDEFDPVRAIESASSPFHYTFGRGTSDGDDPEQRFVRELVNGNLSRDLSTYRGFVLPETISAQGLASGGFGKTIKFAK